MTLRTEKQAIENELIQITEFLTQEGGPGLTGGLIDSEGFPIDGIDIISIRVMRNRRACLKTDLNAIMLKIEKDLHAYHEYLTVNNLVPVEIKTAQQPKSEVKNPTSSLVYI